ncbi:MAG: hypothetical protein WCJ17_03230 [bacterium]
MHTLLLALCCGISISPSLYCHNEKNPEDDTDASSLALEAEDEIYEYQTQAHDILHTFQEQPWIGHEHIRAIELIIHRLNNTPSPHILKPIRQVLRCYQALSLLCADKKNAQQEPSKKQKNMLALLTQRAAIITQIAHAAYPSALAALVVHNLAAYLKRPPTPEELESYADQEKILIQKRNTALEILNKQLFEVEKKILKDPRSAANRYGTAVLAITGVVAVLLGIVRTVEMLRSRTKEKERYTLIV